MDKLKPYREVATQKLQRLLFWKKVVAREAAERTGQSHQNINQKILRGSMRFCEVIQLADAVGADVRFIDRETKEIIS